MDIRKLKEEVVLTGCASEDEFIRLPEHVLAEVPRLNDLSRFTSGIRISFETDSKKIRINARNGGIAEYVHMPISATSGFDVYVNNVFKGNARPEVGSLRTEGEVVLQKDSEMNLVDIYFPLYNSVAEFGYILDDGAAVVRPIETEKPVLFYGSSITHGACASRPGNNYVNMLGRMIERPVINLGFSGNARGDIPVAEYIASLDIAAFVYDYDHNAPTTEFLRETHEPFFRLIRERKPELPVIMMSRPGYEKWSDIAKYNTEVVMTTYLNALKAGDENVYFIDGKTLFGNSGRDVCSVDGTHPNDIGFLRMARHVLPVMKEILED